MREGQTYHSSKHVKVVSRFFERADELRAVFDARFTSPRSTSRERFVWDYWHVPEQYTYIRTLAQYYFPSELYSSFLKHLRDWGETYLGCNKVIHPWLSFYIDGCRQELHTDVPQGAWAYVFSLTHWDTRKFTGGETVLLNPMCLAFWQQFPVSHAVEMDSIFEKILPLYNQLTVFDPRIPHGVSTIEGTRDPLDSRLVLHGWFSEPTLRISGPITLEQVRSSLANHWTELIRALAQLMPVVGLAVARLQLNGEGRVQTVDLLTNTLVARSGNSTETEQVTQTIITFLRTLRFPAMRDQATLYIPIHLPFHE